MSNASKPLQNFMGTLTGAAQLRVEKNRLEAFLSAMPGEYCGFSKNGDVLFSKNFPKLLGLQKIEKLYDIQNSLKIEDSTRLERLFTTLQETGAHFTLNIHAPKTHKDLQISGVRGNALDESDYFDILWLKDITQETQKIKQLEQKSTLSENEAEKLQIVLNNVNEPFWLRDENSNLVWVNQAYVQLVQKDQDHILKNQIELLVKPKEKSSYKTPKYLGKEVYHKGEKLSYEGHIIVDGKRLFVEISEMPLQQKNQTLGMMRDFTAIETKNTEYNRHLTANKTLLEQLRTAVAIYNGDQELEFFNSAYAQLWDLEDQWLNTHPKLGDILEKLRETRRLPEQADFRHYKQEWLNMFTSLIDPHDDMLYLPDGSALRMLIMPHPLGGLMMTFEDVTNNLELESSYNTLIAVQKETLDNLAEGVAVFGGNGRLKLYNPSYAQLWQLNPEDLEGEPHITKLAERMVLLFDKEHRDHKKTILIGHGIERTIQEGRCTLSNDILIEYTTVPLPDGGVLVSYFDVTDSAKVENALREKNAALETAEQLKTDFLANVSYQLRTPLNAIIGFAEILNNEYFGELNEKQKEYSLGIHDAGDKLVHLIDDILDLSTIEAGYLELNYNEFSVHDMLTDLHNLTKEWALKEQITITIDCAKSIGALLADERRIKQALLNLIRNAINFTPEGGTITIATKKDDEYVEFCVSDTGIGISKTDLERIFEPFERATHEHRADMSSHALSRGAGLGLTLVKNIINLHGGEVNITSEEGKGTDVKIKIPLAAPALIDMEDDDEIDDEDFF